MRINQSISATTGADFRNGMVKRVKLRQRAKFRGDRSNHRRDMAIFRLFKMAVDAIMDFNFYLKLLTVGRLKKGRTASLCQISSTSVKPRRRYGDFSIFPRWRPSAMLDLLCVCSDHNQRAFGGLYRCAKFGWS